MARTTPRVENCTLMADGGSGKIQIDSQAWFTWLETATTFAFASTNGTFTARKERGGRQGWYWKAYRKRAGKLYRAYLGKSTDLTLARLNAVAARLAVDQAATDTLPSIDPPPDIPSPDPGIEHSIQPAAILTTKLYVPRPGHTLVSRPRLIEQLSDGWRRKLILVSAPAGFGKTTLLSEWLSRAELPIAWVSLDAGDNDPARFWTHFIAALGSLSAGVSQHALGVLLSPNPPPMELVLTALINAISAVPRELAIVLDDYHVIDNQPIHASVMFLLDHMPPTFHLVISSRVDPPLPLGRLRTCGELTELRVVDLRFTTEETADFLGQVMKLQLAPEDVATLQAHTEGWIAGLQLAALSVQGRDDVRSFIRSFTGSHRYIMDYLVEEVLARQPVNIQTFLLQTSILDQLTGPLCDAVTRQTNSQAILAALDRANLFVIPLDAEQRWYRYHHLFTDLLRHRLRLSQPEGIAELHRRASEWYERTGLVAEAIRHALAVPDAARAARLIQSIARTMLLSGEVVTLRNWLDNLPDDLIRDWPQFCINYAWVLLIMGEWDALEYRLHEAEVALSTNAMGLSTAEIQEQLGHVVAMRAIAASNHGNVTRTIELAHLALEHLPESNGIIRSSVTSTLGDAYWASGDLTAASRAYAEASRVAQACGNMGTALVALRHLATLQAIQGRLRQAAETHQRAIQLGTGQRDRPLPAVAGAYIGMGELLRQWNDLSAARHHVKQAIQLCERWGTVGAFVDAYTTLARVLHTQGDSAGALEAIQKAETLLISHPTYFPGISTFMDTKIRLWLAQGNMAAATDWAQEYGLSAADDITVRQEVEYLALVRVLMAREQTDDALNLLARLIQSAEAGGRVGRVIEMLSLRALALQAQGDTAQAMKLLRRALLLAEPEGYVRLFLDEGEPMAAMLRQAAARGIAVRYVEKLLAAFPHEKRTTTAEINSAALQVEQLSERELEVLRLLAAGRSNREIADELIVTVGTVKTHVNHIYGKLAAHNRTHAVARARELKLL